MLLDKILSKIKLSRANRDIDIKELENIVQNNANAIVLDVRNREEFKEGHLKGAINIPLYDLKQLVEIRIPNKLTMIIVYCQVGIRSKEAVKILEKIGYKNLYHLKNGIEQE